MASTEHITSPALFRKWAAIVTVAGALERKVWVRTKGSELYPNLYAVLVAPPGVGKTEVVWRARSMWESLEEHHIAGSSVTKASLIDSLNEAERRIVRPDQNPPVFSFNSLQIASNELGVLLPSYDNEFMNVLTDLYDGKNYSERRRTAKINIQIKHPNLTILAGCTPGYLRETLPPGAWDQGFLSRVLLIYSGETELRSLFDEEETNTELDHALKSRLAEISELMGRFVFTKDAAQFIDAWHLGGQEPRPDHPRLAHYCTRRTAHLLKLSMIASAASRLDLRITIEDIQRALDWLIEAEFYMADIFKSMTSGGDSQLIEDTWHHLYTLYMKDKKPIGEHRMVHFLQERTPTHNIVRVLEIMERSKMIQKTLAPGVGTAYVPVKLKPV